jgi:hypothetical protein
MYRRGEFFPQVFSKKILILLKTVNVEFFTKTNPPYFIMTIKFYFLDILDFSRL